MPQVAKCLEATYGKPMSSFEPNEAVAKGAALMAAFSYDCGSNDGNADSSNSGDAGEQAQGGNEISVRRPDGKEIVVDDIINKSYGVKIYNREDKKHLIVNLLKSGTSKPCSGTNVGILDLVIGGATAITVCETDFKDDIIDYDEAYDVYSGPLNVPAGLDPETPVEIVFDLNLSGILSIKTIAGGIETNLVFDPSTGGATTEGVDQAKKLSLG